MEKLKLLHNELEKLTVRQAKYFTEFNQLSAEKSYLIKEKSKVIEDRIKLKEEKNQMDEKANLEGNWVEDYNKKRRNFEARIDILNDKESKINTELWRVEHEMKNCSKAMYFKKIKRLVDNCINHETAMI